MNTGYTALQVRLNLPDRMLFCGEARKLVAVASNGSFGLLPNHVDFVSDIVPSVMIITDTDEQEMFFGVDEGLLVKQGPRVDIVLRRGVQSADLESLTETVMDTFLGARDEESLARTALSHLEATMVRRFMTLRSES